MPRWARLPAALCLLALAACGPDRTDAEVTPASPTAAPAEAAAMTRAANWVERMGGSLGSGTTAWVADRDTWRRGWPWPSATAVVNCAVVPAGNTYVVLADRNKYVLTSSAGLSRSLYEGDAFEVARDKAAAVTWADRARAVCQGRG